MHPGLYALIGGLIFAIVHGFHFSAMPLTDAGYAVQVTRFAPHVSGHVSGHVPGNRDTAARPGDIDLRYAGID